MPNFAENFLLNFTQFILGIDGIVFEKIHQKGRECYFGKMGRYGGQKEAVEGRGDGEGGRKQLVKILLNFLRFF